MADDCRIFTKYVPDNPPDHPGESWTRFVCISDTHSQTKFAVPAGDVLLHGGDLSAWGTLSYLKKTTDWLTSLPHDLKIIIAGNHDICLDSSWIKSGVMPQTEFDNAQAMLRGDVMHKAGLVYLQRETVDIQLKNGTRWKIYGSPAAPVHLEGAFQYETKDEAELEWAQIPRDTEILLTHTPPFGRLDLTHRGKNVGCSSLLNHLEEMKQLRLHVFGHIHESHGALLTRRSLSNGHLDLVSVNGALTPSHPLPVIVDMRKVDFSQKL